jgi:hypothetical protein
VEHVWRGITRLVVYGIISTFALGLRAAEPACRPTQPLAARQKWAQFAIQQGQIQVLVARGQTGTLSCQATDTEDWEETFGVHTTPQSISVRYTYRSPRDTASYHFSGQDHLVIERSHWSEDSSPDNLAAARHVKISQSPQQGIEVVILKDDHKQMYQAPTWWHLLLAEPELSSSELIPLLTRLRPDWRLELQAGRIESLLRAQPLDDPIPPLDQLVGQLADDRFEVRRRADRELRAHGPLLLPFLNQLDSRRFSAEQRIRIARLREGLGSQGEDTPHRVAGWLSYDAWLGRCWLESPQPERQQFARRQLLTVDANPGLAQQPDGDGRVRR